MELKYLLETCLVDEEDSPAKKAKDHLPFQNRYTYL